jgi:demethylmenaquinone methyltransferase/2-methoxy-6-polyprenyl-1,4-benzoquinol methylase
VGIDEHGLLAEQMAYYRARATGYDRAYAERQGLQELLAIVDELPIVAMCWSWRAGRGSGRRCSPRGRVP